MKRKKDLKKYIKFLSAILTVAVVFSLSGCGVSEADYKKLERRVAALEEAVNNDTSNSYNSVTDNSATDSPSAMSDASGSSKTNSSGSFDAEEVSDDIDIQEYDYIDNNGDKYAFFIFSNGSDYDVTAKIKVVYKDSNGNELDTDTKNVIGIPESQRSYAGFRVDKNTATIVRTVTYSEYDQNPNMLSDLVITPEAVQGGAKISFNNIGSVKTDDIRYLTLFFKNNKFVAFDSDELTDIEPGSNVTINSAYYGDFDNVDVVAAIDE